MREYRTKTGEIVTEDQIWKWAEEAEDYLGPQRRNLQAQPWFFLPKWPALAMISILRRHKAATWLSFRRLHEGE